MVDSIGGSLPVRPREFVTKPEAPPVEPKKESALRTFARDVVTIGAAAVTVPVKASLGISAGASKVTGQIIDNGLRPMSLGEKIAGFAGAFGGGVAGVMASVAIAGAVGPLGPITALFLPGVGCNLGAVTGVSAAKIVKGAVKEAGQGVREGIDDAVRFGKWLIKEK